ncbi:hypothetical protein HN713_01065, partial [bacterium]|nr:hypothetical protein [bacterium]
MKHLFFREQTHETARRIAVAGKNVIPKISAEPKTPAAEPEKTVAAEKENFEKTVQNLPESKKKIVQ